MQYQRGRRRKWLNDDLQLGAQAICLEEMTGRDIMRGAIFHASSRRRREVAIDASLRRQVEEAVRAIREMLGASKLPAPVNDRRCPECSLIELCQPAAVAGRQRLKILAKDLFEPES